MKEIEGIEGIRRILRESVNTTRRNHLRKMQRHLLGFNPDGATNGVIFPTDLGTRVVSENVGESSDNGFSAYDLLTRTSTEYLRSAPILNNLRITLAQTRAVDLNPDWMGMKADDPIVIARKAWWQQRAQGIDGYGGWKDDLDRAYMDFAALGQGYLRIAACKYPDGYRVGPRYISPLNVMTDPYAPSIDESRMCSFVTVMGIEEAESMFPDYDFDKPNAKQTYMTMEGVTTEGVQIVEYFHINEKDDAPGYLALINDDKGDVLSDEDNPFKFLPLGSFINFQPPGASMPIGLVEMQAFDQKEIEESERDIKRKSKRDAQIAAFKAFIHPDDWEAMERGEDPWIIRMESDPAMLQALVGTGITPLMNIPRVAVNEDRYQWMQMRQRSIDEKSGIGANSAGVTTGDNTTATEVDSINARLGAQSQFLSREFSRGYQSFATKIGRAAQMFDTAPFTMTFMNTPVEFNKGSKTLTSKYIWKGSLNAVIGEEDLMSSDVNKKKEKEIAKAQLWLQAVSSPAAMTAPDATIMLGEALGITDPAKYLPKMPAQAQVPGAPMAVGQ